LPTPRQAWQISNVIGQDMDELTPVEKLISLLLNEATTKGATEVIFSPDINPKLIDLKFKISEKWIDQDKPPKLFWKYMKNLFSMWSGHEYWKKESLKGKINRFELYQDWDLEINQDKTIITLKPITKADASNPPSPDR